MQLLKSYNDWLPTWSLIVPGFYARGPATSLLFYDDTTGQVDFYSVDLGNITRLGSTATYFGAGWTNIVSGNFTFKDSQDSFNQINDLLFYNRATGEALFCATALGGIRILTSFDLGVSWDLIVAGHFTGDPLQQLEYDAEIEQRTATSDLLLYNRNAGVAAIYSVRDASPSLVREYSDWSTTHSQIVPGQFGSRNASGDLVSGSPFSGLMIYDSTTGETSFNATDGNGGLTQLSRYTFSVGLTFAPGRFGGAHTGMVAYQSSSGNMLVAGTYQGGWIVREDNPAWRTQLDALVPGNFSGSGWTDLLTYRRSTPGVGEFHRFVPSNPFPVRHIEGYASATSAALGENIGFHLSIPGAAAETVGVEVIKHGATDTLVFQVGGISVSPNGIPEDSAEHGCGWPEAYSLYVDPAWGSGLFVARFSTATDQTDISFVVKAVQAAPQSQVLMCVAVATHQAYNWWGGRNLYGHGLEGGLDFTDPRAYRVSLDRPMLAALGNDYVTYELPFARWLAKNGIDVDFCTSVDLHSNPGLLTRYNLLMSVGHDEYWSKEMRDNVEAFVASGGNVAFFSGNVCWWQVRFEDGDRTMVCYKNAQLDPLIGVDDSRVTVRWYDEPANRPENSMTGVSWRFGAVEPAAGNNLVAGKRGWAIAQYRIQNPNSWVFSGTGKIENDTFGAFFDPDAATMRTVVAGETDGVNSDRSGGTPGNFEILAVAELGGWVNFLGENPCAVMGIYTNPGTVFTAGTLAWPFGVGKDETIDRIALNVINRLTVVHLFKPVTIGVAHPGLPP